MKLFNLLTTTFRILEESMPKEQLMLILKNEYEDLYRLHFGLGMWIRNNILKEDAPISMYFKNAGVKQKDDMSSIIISMFYFYLKEK